MIKRSKVIYVLKEILHDDELIYLIEYGNRNGKDIDLLAVYKEAPYNECVSGIIDLTCLNINLFRELAILRDPVVTEPIQTGTLLVGKRRDFYKERSQIINAPLNPNAIAHLLQKSFYTFSNAKIFLDRYKEDKSIYNLIASLYNLAYSCSYFYLAQSYSKNAEFLIFKDILSKFSILGKVVHILKKIKTKRKILPMKSLLRLYKEWQIYLVRQ